MERYISYQEFTSTFLRKLKTIRDHFFQVINQTNSDETLVKDVLVQLLMDTPNGLAYAEWIQGRIKFRRIYKKLIKIEQNCSQSAFEGFVDNIKGQLDQQFEKVAEQLEGLSMLGIVKGINEPEAERSPVNMMPQLLPLKSLHPSNQQEKVEKEVQASKASNVRQSKSPQKMIQEPVRVKQAPLAPMKIDNEKPELQIRIQQISSTDLEVEVKYLESLVDVQNYTYNNFKLKDALNVYINKYLKEHTIVVLTNSPTVRIMDDTSYIKSKDAGNYRFNPYCDAVQIILKRNNNEKFDLNFKVTGNVENIKIAYKKYTLKHWSSNKMKLTPKNTIRQLIEFICKKRQAGNLVDALRDCLERLGGANTIQDLYGWERSDYTSLHVKPTFIFEIQQIVEQIKDNSQIDNGGRGLNDRKKKCIQTANSHKILRYCVYSGYGAETVKRIAWLNMENLNEAIKIVKEQIYNQELLDQLNEYFNQFSLDPDNSPIDFSRGLILYGPPGTGKTVLTQALPNIIGFHLIENGLSAADFMKSMVGESSRMIKDLVNRAAVSPYILCSVGIDEVDGLVPDRKDKDEKNKGEGISMLLSVIGGNKNVSNLVFMTSTNYLKKIDEAIRRRLSGQYQVGRPNPEARTQILLKKLNYLKGKDALLNHAIKITTNFTGAAMGGLGNFLLKSLKIKKMNNRPQELSISEITEAAILAAGQFSIKLGVYTLPEIFSEKQSEKSLFSDAFLEKISRHFMFVKHDRQNNFDIMYATDTKRNFGGNVIQVYEKQKQRITIPYIDKNPSQSFGKYICSIFPEKSYNITIFKEKQHSNVMKYRKEVRKYLQLATSRQLPSKKTVLVIEDITDQPGSIIYETNLFEFNNKNLYIFYYLSANQDIFNYCSMAFGQELNEIKEDHYSGRIMVQLNSETRMAFELKSNIEGQSKVTFKLFLKAEENSSPKTVIPELVDFFTKQNVSYLLLIDYELLLQNDAFEEKKVLEVMEEKMMEAKNYERVAVILNLDSMVMLNENASDSNFGRSMSYSIQNHNLYQILLSYMRDFAIINGRRRRWMTIIAKHPQLINIVKKHLDWPFYPEDYEKKREQQAKDDERQCARCDIIYKDRSNQEERKCMQHPGRIIDTKLKAFQHSHPEKLKAAIVMKKMKKDKNEEKNNEDERYVYACCLKGLNEQGCQAFYHIEQHHIQKEKDDLHTKKLKLNQKWHKVLSYFT